MVYAMVASMARIVTNLTAQAFLLTWIRPLFPIFCCGGVGLGGGDIDGDDADEEDGEEDDDDDDGDWI
jgi:hypothetical protein